MTINGFYKNDIIEPECEYLVKFENTELLSSINCKIARDDNENLVIKPQNKKVLEKSDTKTILDISTIDSARKVLRELFKRRNKIRSNPMGASFFQVSIREEIVSSPYSFTDIKKLLDLEKNPSRRSLSGIYLEMNSQQFQATQRIDLGILWKN